MSVCTGERERIKRAEDGVLMVGGESVMMAASCESETAVLCINVAL